jgi:phenylpropionate dioxygenase-like ring-hydroxylating dioxygenase large terminal subunit
MSVDSINPDISRAWSLPAPRYHDPETFRLEKQRIFARTWQVVGHRHQVAQPGDFFTFELVGEPLLLVRGQDGNLRCFYNVCRHRAGPPAEGCGSRKLFRCGYHGWTYDLDGTLLNAPEFEGVADFKASDFALAPVRAEEWFNLVFVNLDPEAHRLSDALGPMKAQAEKFDFLSMRLHERRTYDMKCNWKAYIDNYLEGYHLPSVHPALNRELDYGSYSVKPHHRYVRQWSPIRGAQAGDATPRRYQEARENLTTDYFWMFPNWMLNCYPDNVSLNIILPLEPERTVAIFDFYLTEDGLNSSAAHDATEFSHQVQIEDVAICETVQKNLHSRSYERGRYSPKQEKGVHAFHRMYAEAMGI